MSELYELVCKVKGVEQHKVVFFFVFFLFFIVVNFRLLIPSFCIFLVVNYIRLVFRITSI